ncbi:MAG: M14 family metallopeptidase [Steroidobacteraceae bacterium]
MRALQPPVIGATLFALLAAASVQSASKIDLALTTDAERSGYQRTGDYNEVMQLCADFAAHYPKSVSCVEFGRTPQGRAMLALVVAGDGEFDAARTRALGRQVVLLQGGIHAGEIDGKDAGFRYLRDLLTGRVSRDALKQLTIVFVPVFNVDGHERRGRWNRPNQNGPEETGWRVTAQNLNLNRDYAKADAPEMRAMLALLNAWDPILYADLHVTDGAQFEHDISITLEPSLSGDTSMASAGRRLQQDILAHLTRHGSLPVPFYPAFLVDDDPATGFAVAVAPPRFSTTYYSLRNRYAVLVETHSWKPYGQRVEATYRTIEAMVDLAARDGGNWRELAYAADARALAGQQVPLSYENTKHSTMIDFRGYAYSRTPSEISGALMTHYDPSSPQIWHVPLLDEVKPATVETAPGGGYLLPETYAGLADRLAAHGLVMRTVTHGCSGLAGQRFRADSAQWASTALEGHVPLTVTGSWENASVDAAAGAIFLPIAQPAARLAMALLEPRAPDSLVSWGFFDSAFEQKEYMEAYVAEKVAREMLANDPQVRDAFNQRLATDAAFRSNPAARLDFFYRRHAAWDKSMNLYPVARINSPLPVECLAESNTSRQ